ncbi:MAG: hypothetical protein AAFV43_00010 [Planctomycetota bacterium]
MQFKKGGGGRSAYAYVFSAPDSANTIYVNDLLFDVQEPELFAATLVHEATHLTQATVQRNQFYSEKEAYIEQSRFLRSVGVSGGYQEIRGTLGNPRLSRGAGGWIRDQGRNMQYYQLSNAAIEPDPRDIGKDEWQSWLRGHIGL